MKITVPMSKRYYQYWYSASRRFYFSMDRENRILGTESSVVVYLIEDFIAKPNPAWFGRFNEGDLEGNPKSKIMKKVKLTIPDKILKTFIKKCEKLNMNYKFAIVDMMNRFAYGYYYNRRQMNALDQESRMQISNDYTKVKDDYMYTILDPEFVSVIRDYSERKGLSMSKMIIIATVNLIEDIFSTIKDTNRRRRRTIREIPYTKPHKRNANSYQMSIKVPKKFLKYVRYYTRNCGVATSTFIRYAIERMIKNDINSGKVQLSEEHSMYFEQHS